MSDITSPADTVIDDDLRAQITQQLDGQFKGDIIGPDHPEYEPARQLWNAMIDRRPGLILRCTSTADVVAAVNVAREHSLYPSVRCGGHNVAGKGMSEGGLTLDLSGLREVTVDPENKLVHVGGGCRLGDVDAAASQHGLIVPAGIMSETGVAGLSLGGGIGWFSRPYGLTCDQFVSLELVLASGEVIEVTEAGHPDLMWALRGGGGNFGIVTRFTFRAQEFGPMMRIGVALYEVDDAAQALREYAALYPTLPRSVGYHAALKRETPALPFVPPELAGKRLLMLVAMWLEDAEAIDTLVRFWRDMPMEGEVELIGLGGAIGDVAEDATAFSNREYQLWLNFAMRWDDPDCDADYMARTRRAVADLEPWLGRGVYFNMLNMDELDRVVEALGGPEKYARLGRVKAQYDPENLFRANYNITPVTSG